MLKNIAKVALVSFAALGMAMPALAADPTGSVTGRAYSYFSQSTSKASDTADAVTTMTMGNYSARLGYTDSLTEGEWTGKAKTELQVTSTSGSGKLRDSWVSVENEGMKIKFGRAWYLGHTDADYGVNQAASRQGDRFNALAYSPKGIANLDLTALLTMGNGSTLFGADSMEKSNDTGFGLGGTYSADALTVNFQFASGNASANVNQGAVDGGKLSVSLMGLKIGYQIDDAMSAGFSYNSSKMDKTTATVVTADDGSTSIKTADSKDGDTVINLWFAMDLGNDASVYAAFETEDDVVADGDEAAGETGFAVGYSTSIAGIGLDVDYATHSGTGSDTSSNSALTVGMYQYF